MKIILNDKEFILLYQKALYDSENRLLVIADVHLGKALHFRKEGIPIPAAAQMADYNRLQTLFEEINPLRVYFLGDLFHSSFNKDWHLFCGLINTFPDIEFTLLKGNHDLIDTSLFSDLCIEVTDIIEEANIIYSHKPMSNIAADKINVCGHIHPGISLSGAGRQRVKLPCFYLYENVFILPAFGVLTGLYLMEQKKNATIFIVLPEKVRSIL